MRETRRTRTWWASGGCRVAVVGWDLEGGRQRGWLYGKRKSEVREGGIKHQEEVVKRREKREEVTMKQEEGARSQRDW